MLTFAPLDAISDPSGKPAGQFDLSFGE